MVFWGMLFPSTVNEGVKTNEFLLYFQSIDLMSDLFFSYDCQNYACYLIMFCVLLANVDDTHPGALDLLKRGAISVARAMIPGFREDVDRTTEETIMRDSKTYSGASGTGISGITRNYAAYQRWILLILDMHERSKYTVATFSLLDIGFYTGDHHKDVRKSEVKRSQDNVRKTVDALKNFLNPFSVNKDKLYCVPSAAAVPPEIEKDLLEAEKKGKEARMEFVHERLKKGEKFFEPIRKQKLKTMANMKKSVKLKTT